MTFNLKPIKDGIKEVIRTYKADCCKRVTELKRYDEFNMYGNPAGYKNLVKLEEVIAILKEEEDNGPKKRV